MEQPAKRRRQATPKRQGRVAQPGSKFPSEILATNIRNRRKGLWGISQSDLAERMHFFGFEGWHRATVSEIERGGRSISVDELIAVALCLGMPLFDLLDPLMTDGVTSRIDVGAADWTLSRERSEALIAGGESPGVEWDGNTAVVRPMGDKMNSIVSLLVESREKERADQLPPGTYDWMVRGMAEDLRSEEEAGTTPPGTLEEILRRLDSLEP